MRKVSSHMFSRIEDCDPARMVTACLCSEIEDGDANRTVSCCQLKLQAASYLTLELRSMTCSPHSQSEGWFTRQAPELRTTTCPLSLNHNATFYLKCRAPITADDPTMCLRLPFDNLEDRLWTFVGPLGARLVGLSRSPSPTIVGVRA